MFKTGFVLQPDNEGVLPFQIVARATDGDFFSLFNVPFLYGAAHEQAEHQHEQRHSEIDQQDDKIFHASDLLLDDHGIFDASDHPGGATAF